MTVEQTIRKTLNLLAAVGVGNWNVEVGEFVSKPNRSGLCSYRNHTIYISAKILDDEKELLATIQEEVAHVISADTNHGENFRRALDFVCDAANSPSAVRDRKFRIEVTEAKNA